MMKTKQFLMLAGLALCLPLSFGALAQEKISDGVVKIGVMNDMSGPYSDVTGRASVVAANMAMEDFIAKEKPKFKIEVVSTDHQNKPDIASAKAREWFDRDKVDVIVDLPTSSAAIAVVKVAKEKNKLTLVSGGGTASLTNQDCTDTNVHWTYDTYALAAGSAKALVKMGGDTWYLLVADYAFGSNMEKDATNAVNATGGKVLGSVRHPFPASDFSSYMLMAQGSKAKVIGLANAGSDTQNAIKATREYGLTDKQIVAPLLLFINDVHSLGLKMTQGMYLTDGFYWDMNDETRAWSKRFFERHKAMPNMVQAGVYSAITHYLKAIKAGASDDTQTVMAKMKATPVNDFFAKNGRIRADGRMVHDMYLMQVKKPEESKYPWDYFHVKQVIPGNDAFQAMESGTCPLIKK
jgi:branched-chain amino acid transport system substrate-binding protein